MQDDVTRLRESLAPVADAAQSLRWADKRPWQSETHVFWSDRVPTVDLHDLNAKLAKRAVRVCCEHPPETGAIFFVTGAGRHSLGPGVLGGLVKSELKRACADRPWSFRPAGPARFVLITDRSRAPSAATGALGPLFWLFLLLLAAGLAATLANLWAP